MNKSRTSNSKGKKPAHKVPAGKAAGGNSSGQKRAPAQKIPGHNVPGHKIPGKGRRGIVVVVAGPSGSGKSTLIRRLLAEDPRMRWSVSYTTRDRRPGERNGRDYHFVSRDQFQKMVKRNEFLEYAYVHGMNYYGTGKQWVQDQLSSGQDILIEVDLQGAMSIRAALKEAILVFISPPSLSELKHRLRLRSTESRDQIQRRLKTAETEMQAVDQFDYVVRNVEVETALMDLKHVIGAERCRVR